MQSSRISMAVLATVAAATLTATLTTTPAGAQGAAATDVRPNAWYWGVYGGQTSFPTTIARTTARMVGAEWMITRTHFALNVFAEQSYFNAVSTIPDFPSSAPRRVDIQDMRTVGASAMIFLPSYKYFHPWFAPGYAYNFIRTAAPEGNAFASPAARDSVTSRVDEGRAQGKMFAEVGVLFSYRDWAPFAAYTVMPTKGSSSWMVNGEGFTNVWKLGVRYNFGTAIGERW